MDKKKIIKMYMQKAGRKGGMATLENNGKAHFSRAGKLGMAKRWGTKVSLEEQININKQNEQ